MDISKLTTKEKEIRTKRINKFNKIMEENDGIPMLLSYIFLNKEAKRFQLGVDFPRHILRGGYIQYSHGKITEEEILTSAIEGLEEILKKLRKDVNKTK